jgi:hypothetical protein
VQTWTYSKPLVTVSAVALIAILLTSALLWGLALAADRPSAPRFAVSVLAIG